MEKKGYLIWGVICIIVAMFIGFLIGQAPLKDLRDTKDHFGNSLRFCLEHSKNQKEELDRCYLGYLGWTDGCEFKGRISMEQEYVSHWIRAGYVCDIYKIVNNTIGCYVCDIYKIVNNTIGCYICD